jgi:hypothetical protein
MTTAAARGVISIDLGCGAHKVPGTIGVDAARTPGADVIARLDTGLPFRDGSVDVVHAYYVLERHNEDFLTALYEIWRVLRDGGTAHVKIAHASSPYAAWRTPGQRRGLSLATFTYFDTSYFAGAVFSYYSPANFRIEEAKLHFTATGRPQTRAENGNGASRGVEPGVVTAVRRVLGPVLDTVANRNRNTQYLCERFWGPVVGMEEASLVLRAIKG